MKNEQKHYLILILLALIWGSSFILMEKGLHTNRGVNTYSYMQVGALRIFIAFISLLPFLYFSLRRMTFDKIRPLIIVGVIGNGIPAFLFTLAQDSLESSFVGILNSLTPIFTLIIGIYYFSSKTSVLNMIGILIGFFGAFLISFSKIQNLDEFNIPILAVILATIFYGISLNIIKKDLKDLDAISITSLSFLFIGPIAGYYIFNTDFLEIARTDNGLESLIYILILGTLCTSLPVIIFNQLVKETSAIFAASVTYLIPIVALFWGLIDGELITKYHVIGMIVILSGVYLVNKD